MTIQQTAQAADEPPEVGAIAFDAREGRVGVVMQRDASGWYLRPVGGGVEWTASAADVRRATVDEELSAKVRLLNRRCVEGRH